jgi:cobalt-zinc-cadmium efflux system protein
MTNGPGHRHSGDHRKPLRTALLITSAVLVVEAVGGFLSRSLALLADAGHMLTDVAALGLGLFAFWLSARPPSSRRTSTSGPSAPPWPGWTGSSTPAPSSTSS